MGTNLWSKSLRSSTAILFSSLGVCKEIYKLIWNIKQAGALRKYGNYIFYDDSINNVGRLTDIKTRERERESEAGNYDISPLPCILLLHF